MSRRVAVLLLFVASASCYGGWVLWKARSLRSDLRSQCEGVVRMAKRHQLDALDVTRTDAKRMPFRDVGLDEGDLVDVRLVRTKLDHPPSASFREVMGYCLVELKFVRATRTVGAVLDRGWDEGSSSGWTLKALLLQD